MAFQFTPGQTQVLEARRHNVLVSAAAGSGKTAVLVERILRMISEDEHPLDIDRLLVVTFTRAAAAQMRERIGRAIAKRIAEHPDDRHLQRQEALLYRAQITTIDSFCMSLLRNNFSEIDLDPGFRQMDETQTRLLGEDCLQKFLEEQYAAMTPSFVRCVDYFCPGEDDRALEELIRKLYRAAQSHPYPREWLEERGHDYDIRDVQTLTGSGWYRQLLLERKERLDETRHQYLVLLQLCAEPDGPYPYLDTIQAEYDALFGGAESEATSQPESEEDVRLLRARLLQAAHYAFGRLPAVRGRDSQNVDPAKKERVSSIRALARKRLASLAEGIEEDPALTVRRMQEASGPLQALTELAAGYMDAFAALKKERGLIDFNDLEHYALQILIDRAPDGTLSLRRTARSYRDYYDEILIDEYQDSNEVQELLLSAIAFEPEAGFVLRDPSLGRHARFMVGDVKQSIYRFRNARPEIFQNKFDTYSVRESGEIPQTQRIDLDQNFRSRTQVLDAVNGVFTKIMRREIGGIDYDDVVSLKPGAHYPPARPGGEDPDPYQTELLLVEKASGGEEEETDSDIPPEDTGQAVTSQQKEALAVAQRIRQIVGSLPVYDADTGTQHPARYRDIVILLRSASGRQDTYREVFEKEGIPLYLEYKEGYFAADEVRTVLQLLRVIDNPLQDIPLYSVLHGYYGGFSNEEIAQIRAWGREREQESKKEQEQRQEQKPEDQKQREERRQEQKEQEEGRETEQVADSPDIPGGGLYRSLEQAARASDMPAPLTEKCASFLARLDDYRDKSRHMRVSELLRFLVRSTGYEEYVRALPAGQRRGANVHALLVRAKTFEESDQTGLFSFLRYIDQMHAFEVDYGEAGVMDEQADVVRLTTIHKSKGLEYPVCFVCGLGARHPFAQDLRGALAVDPDLGLGIHYVDTQLRCRVPTLRRTAVVDKIARDALGEELRVLYVAMTRAKEKLILTGCTRSAQTLLEKVDLALTTADPDAGHLPSSVIRDAPGFLTLVLESMEAMKRQGQQPVRLCVVSDLQTQEAEDQLTQGELLRALELTEHIPADRLPDRTLAARLEEGFSFRYPYGNLAGLYTKTTVTELKRAAMVDEGFLEEPGEMPAELFPAQLYDDLPRPLFAIGSEDQEGQEGGMARRMLTGAERGTAVHRMCELIDYAEWRRPAEVTAPMFAARVNALMEEGRVPAAYASVLHPRTFLPFLHSKIASRMAAADASGLLKREQPFVLGMPASRLNADFPKEETILIQGIIDAFFIEEDAGHGDGDHTETTDAVRAAGRPEKGRRVVLVDYKTDRVKTPQELIDRYRVQMKYYAEALEKMLRLPVAEKIIYSFELRQEIRM